MSPAHDLFHHLLPALKIVAVDEMDPLLPDGGQDGAVHAEQMHTLRRFRYSIADADDSRHSLIFEQLETVLEFFDARALYDCHEIIARGFRRHSAENPRGVGLELSEKSKSALESCSVFRHAGSGSPVSPDQIPLFREHRDDFVHCHFVDGKLVRQRAFRWKTGSCGIVAVLQPFFQILVNVIRDSHCRSLFLSVIS